MTDEEIRAAALEFAKRNKVKIAKIGSGGQVDDYIAERYTKDELEKCL